MSSFADFRLIEVTKLATLIDRAEIRIERKLFRKRIIDNYWSYLDENSTKLSDFKWSGYQFTNLLVYLQDKQGIDLLSGEFDDIALEIAEKRQNSTFFLSMDHKKKYLERLRNKSYSLKDLMDFNLEFSEEDDPDLARAQLEGIYAVKDHLELINGEHHVVMLTID